MTFSLLMLGGALRHVTLVISLSQSVMNVRCSKD